MIVHEEEGIKQSFKITLTLEGVIIETHGAWSEIYKEVYSNRYCNVRSVRINSKFLYTEFFIDENKDLNLKFDDEIEANVIKMIIEIGKNNPQALIEIIGNNSHVQQLEDMDFDEDKLHALSKLNRFKPQQQPQRQAPAPKQLASVPPLPGTQTKKTPPPAPVFSFFALIDNVQQGPYSEIQFKRLVDNKLANGDTLVWQEGMSEWMPAIEVKLMAKIFPQQQQPSNVTSAPPMPQQSSYFVNVNNQQAGPFTIQQLQHFAQTGEFTQHMYVWKQGMPQWLMAGQVQELTTLFSSQMPQMPKI